MNLTKVVPFLQGILDLLWAHRENKTLKKEIAKLRRRIKKLESL